MRRIPAGRPVPADDAIDGAANDSAGRVSGWRRDTLGPDAWPIVRLRGTAPGPHVLVVADAGDALVSAAIAALAVELDPAALSGTCTFVPACALDDPRTLDALERHLLPGHDLVLELGVGDVALRWSPVAIVRLPRGARRGAHGEAAAEAAMVAFGAPESLRLHADAEPEPAEHAMRAHARRGAEAPGAPDIDLGALAAGGAGTLAARAARSAVAHVEIRCGHADASGDAADARLALLRAGCRNVLVDAGALAAPLELRVTRHLELGPCGGNGSSREAGTTVLAGARSTLVMALPPGADVHAGETLARLHDPDRPDAEPAELAAPCDGTLLACRHDGNVAAGDRIALIADQMQP